MTREQLGVCDAVSKHFGITKAKTRARVELYLEENGESPLIEVDSPEGVLQIATSKNTTTLGKMLFFKYLERTDLYSDLINFFDNYKAEAVAFYSGGALMIAYLDQAYNGYGGIFVCKQNTRHGYAIEPIQHYLQKNYPICRED